jgi:hypothetical protein
VLSLLSHNFDSTNKAAVAIEKRGIFSWQLPLMTDLFGIGWEKIIYCLIRPKLGKIVISKQA